ncbi:MAG: alcohol dehydrogenase catalytic domain-containing protein [Patescibacteria group bacterium]
MQDQAIREAPAWHEGLIIAASGEVVCARVPTAKPQEGELLVSILRAGVCGTDVQILKGERHDRTKILGHEGLGVVIGAGSKADESWMGKYVVFNPVDPCDQERILGHSYDGIFQQYFLVSRDARRRGLLVPYDVELPYIYGPLVEPLATVVYAHSLVERKVKPKAVAVVGAGPIGIIHALVSKICDDACIFLINRSPARLHWAIEHRIITHGEAIQDIGHLAEEMLRRTGGMGVDAVYLCTPHITALAALEESLCYVRDGGCINLFGGFSDDDAAPSLPGIELNKIRRANVCGLPPEGHYQSARVGKKTIWITGNRGSSALHMIRAMELLKVNQHLFSRVITHMVSFREAPSFLNTLRQTSSSRVGGKLYMKAVIDFTTT